MANVESMIVEEKTQIKQIDREKVCVSCREAFKFSITGNLMFSSSSDLSTTLTSVLLYGPPSFGVRVHVRKCANQRTADLHLARCDATRADLFGARR